MNEALRSNLTRDMLEEVEETFRAACDPSGILSASRLPLALKALGMSIHHVEDSKMYNDGVDLDKFIEIVLICMKHPNWAANEMNEVFSIIDKDKSGNIDPQELRRIFARLGENLMETEVADQVREFDIDGDYEVGGRAHRRQSVFCVTGGVCALIIMCSDGSCRILQDDWFHSRVGLYIRRQYALSIHKSKASIDKFFM